MEGVFFLSSNLNFPTLIFLPLSIPLSLSACVCDILFLIHWMASRIRLGLDEALRVLKNHPILSSVVVGGAALVIYVAWRAATPAPVFRDEGSSSVRFKSDSELPAQIGGLVRAIRELQAEGLFSEKEGRVVTREFVDLARAGASIDADGEPVLSRPACRTLFERIGIKNQRIADSLFDSFDEDHSGGISLKEFLHALVLVMRGGTSEKIERVFDCIDLDHDGV